jgi:hypothetical protein
MSDHVERVFPPCENRFHPEDQCPQNVPLAQTNWEPGRLVKFQHGDSILEYLGPGWNQNTFHGKVVKSTFSPHKVGDEANTWHRDSFFPLSKNE